MKRIGMIKSFFFADSFLISLAKDWINHLNGIPEFEVFVDGKNRLHLISKTRVSGDRI